MKRVRGYVFSVTPKRFSVSALIPFCILFILIFYSCSKSFEDKEEEDIESAANGFVSHYYNFDFQGALPFCTDESRKWLVFISSSILQEDVDILREQPNGANYEINNIEHVDDTTAVVDCSVFNFLQIDTLGRSGKMTEKADYRIPLVKRGGKWFVKMEGLPRSEMQNHD